MTSFNIPKFEVEFLLYSFFTAMFIPLIYVYQEILNGDEILLFLRPACLLLDPFRCSLLLLITVNFTIFGLSIIHLGFLSPIAAFNKLIYAFPAILRHSESFTLPSCCRCLLLSHFVFALSLASHYYLLINVINLLFITSAFPRSTSHHPRIPQSCH